MIYFDHYYLVPACGFLFFGIVLLCIHGKRYFSSIRLLAGRGKTTLLIGYSKIRRITKYILLFLSLFFCAGALMRIQMDDGEIAIKNEGWQLMVALDISRSMRAADLQPSRLMHAKQKIHTLVQKLSCTKVGLVLFSSDAFVQCPLTEDKEAFALFLNNVDTETMSGGGTALHRALAVTAEALRGEGSEKRIALLVTDGEDFGSEALDTLLSKEGGRIFLCALGIGTGEGAPVPILDHQGGIQGYERDEQGGVIISRLNEMRLSSITAQCAGCYARSDESNADIARIVQFVTSCAKEHFDERAFKRRWDSYPFFLAGGLLCMMLEYIL